MLRRQVTIGTIALLIALSVTVAVTLQAEQERETVTVCDLVENPGAYDKKRVTLTARVSIAFEHFGLVDSQCGDDGNKTHVWLEFGGDVAPPTIYCCGDFSRKPGSIFKVQGQRVPLVKDASFKRLLQLLRARVNRPSSTDAIEATLSGTFFALEEKKTERGTAISGYGHFGVFSLLVIQQVSNVRSVRLRDKVK